MYNLHNYCYIIDFVFIFILHLTFSIYKEITHTIDIKRNNNKFLFSSNNFILDLYTGTKTLKKNIIIY